MFTFGYNSRKGILIKSLIVLGIGIAGLATRTTFGGILGLVLVVFAVRDLYKLVTSRPAKDQAPEEAKEREDGLRITDLSDAREVEYEKEEGNLTRE